MRIEHNITAFMAYGNLARNQTKLADDLEKLASGHRINRAGDDAAGLAISEKMKLLITGLSRAETNAREGIGLIQTGEAALSEVHDMLNRLRELSEQSSNDTNAYLDRQQMQREVIQICDEIGRIASSTNSNGVALFQDEGLDMEREVLDRGMQANNISVDYTQDTRAVHTLDISATSGTNLRDGESFSLNVYSTDGTSFSYKLTARVDSSTNTAQFIDGDGTTVGSQSGVTFGDATKGIFVNAFASALNASPLGQQISFSSDESAGTVTGTARETGSGSTRVVGVSLLRGDTGMNIRETTTLGGDRLPAIRNSAITLYNGKNAEKAVFEINGKKFAVGRDSTDHSKLDADVTWIGMTANASLGVAGDNDTATSEQQADLNNIAAEISRVTGLKVEYLADGTTLSGGGIVKNLFVFTGYNSSNSGSGTSAASAASVSRTSSAVSARSNALAEAEDFGESISLSEILSESRGELKNIIYSETTFDFSTTQSTDGTANSFADGSTYANVAEALKTQIVPQVVSALMSKYTAFNYLSGSSIGIGLNLYSNASESVLASVTSQIGYSSNGGDRQEYQSYMLSVNMAKVGNIANAADRSSLEQTICHEMIHAFMDEATTAGMHGKVNPWNDTTSFPMWFIEGMAQTASGPGNWINEYGGLGLSDGMTTGEIKTALGQDSRLLSTSETNTTAQYGTGYLAAMYLGKKAYEYGDGTTSQTLDMSSPTQAAAHLATGLSKILNDIIKGNSLETVIMKYTGISSISNFESGFASSDDVASFVQSLLRYVTSDAGGLASGDLTATDPVPDAALSSTDQNLNLFALNKDNTSVKNIYPSDVKMLSGGAATASGTAPVGSISDPTPVTPITYNENPFTITGGVENTDWKWDEDTGTLQILRAGDYTISNKSGFTGDYTGAIKLKDGISTDASGTRLQLDGITIDATKQAAGLAGIDIGDNNQNVTVYAKGTATVKGSGNSAGIQLGKDSKLRIEGENDARLTVTGGSSGTTGGAGIGSAYGADASNSEIVLANHIGSLAVTGGYGSAGIGAGMKSTGLSKITIQSDADSVITARGGYGGAGVGGSYSGDNTGLSINIGLSSGTPDNAPTVNAYGGYGAAGIGGGYQANMSGSSVYISHGTVTANGGNSSAGIGAGYQGKFGAITIDDGTITANGGGNGGAGIGNSDGGTLTGDITVGGGTIRATAGEHGAGIGGGWADSGSGGIQNIIITGGDIRAISTYHGTGIGAGCGGKVLDITISGGDTKIYAKGGDDGAAIGAGSFTSSSARNITISGGVVEADGGSSGSGIGSGNGSSVANITISGGVIKATGKQNSSGIGSGYTGTIQSVSITGGSVTAKGGWTNGGGNIGGYSTRSSTSDPIDVTISGAVVKAGSGEGKYITTSEENKGGAIKDSDGNTIYSLALTKENLKAWQDVLNADSDDTNNGTLDFDNLTWPVKMTIEAETDGGTEEVFSGSLAAHMAGTDYAEDGAYFWTKGQNLTVTVSQGEGQTATFNLLFSEGAGTWYLQDTQEPPEAVVPTYQNTTPTPTPTPTPAPAPAPASSGVQGNLNYGAKRGGGIILHIGPNTEDTLLIPRFYFSKTALALEKLDVSNREGALKSLDMVDKMIERVSDMRGEYGALQNGLEHIINNLNVSKENITAAESLIRDTNMAEEMSDMIKNQILTRAAQAMLAQANLIPETAMEMLQ